APTICRAPGPDRDVERLRSLFSCRARAGRSLWEGLSAPIVAARKPLPQPSTETSCATATPGPDLDYRLSRLIRARRARAGL
ncbi:MAG: hypothetical protein KAU38_00180, partial [Desulfobacterales bacterium]|nr:hypothetical protein [Desulfobacterales bacterium]